MLEALDYFAKRVRAHLTAVQLHSKGCIRLDAPPICFPGDVNFNDTFYSVDIYQPYAINWWSLLRLLNKHSQQWLLIQQ